MRGRRHLAPWPGRPRHHEADAHRTQREERRKPSRSYYIQTRPPHAETHLELDAPSPAARRSPRRPYCTTSKLQIRRDRQPPGSGGWAVKAQLHAPEAGQETSRMNEETSSTLATSPGRTAPLAPLERDEHGCFRTPVRQNALFRSRSSFSSPAAWRRSLLGRYSSAHPRRLRATPWPRPREVRRTGPNTWTRGRAEGNPFRVVPGREAAFSTLYGEAWYELSRMSPGIRPPPIQTTG